jgi:hypothetical protein
VVRAVGLVTRPADLRAQQATPTRDGGVPGSQPCWAAPETAPPRSKRHSPSARSRVSLVVHCGSDRSRRPGTSEPVNGTQSPDGATLAELAPRAPRANTARRGSALARCGSAGKHRRGACCHWWARSPSRRDRYSHAAASATARPCAGRAGRRRVGGNGSRSGSHAEGFWAITRVITTPLCNSHRDSAGTKLGQDPVDRTSSWFRLTHRWNASGGLGW